MIKEDLRKWFRDRWVRMDTKGNIKGDCAREEGEGKPKCLPLAKARALSKEDRAAAAKRKRREDPVADRQGKGNKPINVRTEEMNLEEQNKPTNPDLWSKAKTLARSKFDVYPSAYANGWAAKWYKSKGGGWKSVKEDTKEIKSLAKKSYFSFREELNTCCQSCLDDTLYGSVEEDFESLGTEEYEDWNLDEGKNTELYAYKKSSSSVGADSKSGRIVGNTMSVVNNFKGANIIKHYDTGKYYAAGGSSTAYTSKTTLHDTPEAAAKAYHKGKLAEGSLEANTPDPVVVIQDKKGKILDKMNLSVAAKKYKLSNPQNVKQRLAHQSYTTIGNYIVASPMSGQPQDNTTQGVAEEVELQEAEKNGRTVQLNKPFRTSDGKGKFAVYTKNDKGNVVKVNFGDTTGLTIKTSDPDRRRNFRARHNCDDPGPKHKARYWSCKAWSKESVSTGLGIK
jgi:hypothetical protein